MKNQRLPFGLQKLTHHFKYGATFVWAFTGTMLIASSVVQASDMQIYAVPTAGKKTIVIPVKTPPNDNLKVIFQKVVIGLAPKSLLASIKDLSIFDNEA